MKKAFHSVLLFLSVAVLLAACGGSDSTPPATTFSVTSTTPLNRVAGVAIQSTISAVFSKAVDTTTMDSTTSFVVTGPSGTVAGEVSFSTDNTIATFTPSAPLAKIKLYTASLTTAVKDIEGTPLAAAYSWTFTTGPVIAAKGSHSLALKSDGTVWAWGYNDYGQSHPASYNPDPAAPNAIASPLVVSGLTGTIVSIAAGGYHSLALRIDGTVLAWGMNGTGQLGDGNPSWAHGIGPVAVQNLTGVTALAAGYWHSVALKTDGTVLGWGSNDKGQLGDGTFDHRSTPVKVSGLGNVTAIAADGEFTLALKSDGTVWAWGDNSYGQLGDGKGVQLGIYSNVPVHVSGLTGIIAISAGYDHGIALKSDGTVWAWGRNDLLQCGVAYTGSAVLTPVQVPGLSGITALTAGDWHNLILKNDGTVWAWGDSGYGKLGFVDPHGIPELLRQTVNLSGTIALLTAGENHSLAMNTDGTLFAWGDITHGQVGNGTISSTDPITTPVQIGATGAW